MTLTIEAIFSETSVLTRATPHNIPENIRHFAIQFIFLFLNTKTDLDLEMEAGHLHYFRIPRACFANSACRQSQDGN
jgi:hypothetical protein